jgi:hypothetical protein
MKIIQLHKGDTFNVSGKIKIIHIGIEHWHSQPIFNQYALENMYYIKINSKDFKINECNILEFDELSEESIEISFPEDGNNNLLDDYAFVTIAYETVTG